MECFLIFGRLYPVADLSAYDAGILENFPRVYFVPMADVTIPSRYESLLND